MKRTSILSLALFVVFVGMTTAQTPVLSSDPIDSLLTIALGINPDDSTAAVKIEAAKKAMFISADLKTFQVLRMFFMDDRNNVKGGRTMEVVYVVASLLLIFGLGIFLGYQIGIPKKPRTLIYPECSGM
jgi:ABC-type Na+ efflux pump permease subunit